MTTPRRTGLSRLWYVASWRARYWWMDTREGFVTRVVLAVCVLLAACAHLWHGITTPPPADATPVQAIANWVIHAIIFVVSMLISMALAPKPKNAEAQKVQVAQVEDGITLRRIYGPVWIDNPTVIGDKPFGTVPIRVRAGKTILLKTKWQTVAHWYLRIFHFALGHSYDKVLAIRGADAEAWAGELSGSGTITVNKPELWGGEESEGGIVGDFVFMDGSDDQEPDPWLIANLAPEQSAYRGKATVYFKGGKWGNSPYFKSPSFLVSRIFEGWDDDTCWYPEKAAILLFEPSTDVLPWVDANDPRNPGNSHEYRVRVSPHTSVNTRAWRSSIEEALADGLHDDDTPEDYAEQIGWSFDCWRINRAVAIDPGDADKLVLHFNRYTEAGLGWFAEAGATGSGGAACVNAAWLGMTPGLGRMYWTALRLDGEPATSIAIPGFYRLLPVGFGGVVPVAPGEDIVNNCTNWPPNEFGYYPRLVISADRWIEVRRVPATGHFHGMNVAHILYDSLTSASMDGEPIGTVNDASFRAAADRLYDEGFGIGIEYDASKETIEQFQQRLCDLAGARLSRDPTTAEWHLDLIRDDIGLDDMPVLTDDDILSIERQPSVLDEAVNQVIVEWFDLLAKEKRSTGPLQALGAIQAFGSVNGEVKTFREILVESLALRVGDRDLNFKSAALDRFNLDTTRKPYRWRSGRKFRLQAPKNGIADMVCVLGSDIDRGTLRSGAIRLTAVQDVASMADATYVQPEPGAAPPITTAPTPAIAQAAFELPYRELLEILSDADMAFLPADAGYVAAVAARPPGAIEYRLMTRVGAEDFAQAPLGEWCPNALVVEACTVDDPEGGLLRTGFTLSSPQGLANVEIGSIALWGDEIVRVDALDVDALTIEFGRACLDTVPQLHAAGERIWFFDAWSTVDPLQRADAQVVQARMLTRTGSGELALGSAPTSTVTLGSRQVRPYPPGRLRINDEAYPETVYVEAALTWVDRDRIAQGATPIDSQADGVGPEAGTTYTARWYLDEVLEDEQTGITGAAATHTPSAGGQLRVEVLAVRDGFESWQMANHTCQFRLTTLSYYVDQDGNRYVDQNGNPYTG